MAAIALGSVAAPKKSANVLDLKTLITDDAIIYPESFETDTKKLLESWYMKNYTDTDDRYRTSSNPSTSDETIRRRLAELPTVIDMPFNQIVRSYIDRYMEQGRPLVASMLGLSTYYMPIFEQALEAEQLPQELKYIPIIESALNPNAVSRSGAGGLWQFMPAAAKGYDMEISSLVDERRDPYVSSKKAAKLFRDLYETYGDWTLAIAAYNCGPGNVNKAIRRAGGDPKQHDFWSIYEYLSPQTRGYVPMFIAANYVMNYYKEHNISPVLPTRPLVTDTVGISRRVHFDQISEVLDIPVEEIRILNPQFRADIIPGTPTRQYMLILPAQQVQAYIMSEDQILAYEADKYARRIDATPGSGDTTTPAADAVDGNDGLLASHEETPDEAPVDPATSSSQSSQSAQSTEQAATPRNNQSNLQGQTRVVTHTVAQGETISEIADRYKVRVSDIRSWNSLRRNAVRPGQKLHIETTLAEVPAAKKSVSKDVASTQNSQSTSKSSKKTSSRDTASSTKSSKKKKAEAKPKVHEIKSGESLSTIARKHGVTVDELRKANNIKGDNIRAGSSLKIPAKGKAGSSKKSGKKKKKK